MCFRNGQFNESNRCQLCNASQSKDSWTKNPGMFTILNICRRVYFHYRISYFKMSVGKGIRFDKILCNFYPITHAHVNLNFIRTFFLVWTLFYYNVFFSSNYAFPVNSFNHRLIWVFSFNREWISWKITTTKALQMLRYMYMKHKLLFFAKSNIIN